MRDANLVDSSMLNPKSDLSTISTGKQKLFSSAISVERDLFLMTLGDFRAHWSKIHKHDRPAMEIADISVPYDKNAGRHGGPPVHK
jgi:hypothetical protein